MSERVHYFAFGSNMARRVLVDRRGIAPIVSRAARVRDHAVKFALRGVPGIEPSFATLVASPGSVAHGVLHTITRDELARLDRIERSYHHVDVVAETADGSFEAVAYAVGRISPERPPSRRYLELLLEGAREHGLPSEYVAELESIRGHHVAWVSPAYASVIRFGESLARRIRRRTVR